MSYSTVRDYVARRRPEIWAEAGRSAGEVFVPQIMRSAPRREVDFADLWVMLGGVKTKTHLFTFRLSCFGQVGAPGVRHPGAGGVPGGPRVCVRASSAGADPAFRYDNLKAAVSRVLTGRNRVESDRWVTFRSHYGFDAFYCQPGVDGAHEKGGVEGEGGRFRRTHCVPMPQVDSLAELNELLAAADAKDDHRRVGNRPQTVGHDFAAGAGVAAAVAGRAVPTWLTLTPRVDRHARVTVRQCQYSVPARLIGRTVRVQLGASQVLIFDGADPGRRPMNADRPRRPALILDHYLEVLSPNPGALPGATALAQARAAGMFTRPMTRSGRRPRARLGDAAGTRALVEVLLLHRHLPAGDVLAGIDRRAAAVGTGQPGRGRRRGPQRRQPAATRPAVVVLPRARSRDGGDRGTVQQVPVLPYRPAAAAHGRRLRPAAHPRRDR